MLFLKELLHKLKAWLNESHAPKYLSGKNKKENNENNT